VTAALETNATMHMRQVDLLLLGRTESGNDFAIPVEEYARLDDELTIETCPTNISVQTIDCSLVMRDCSDDSSSALPTGSKRLSRCQRIHRRHEYALVSSHSVSDELSRRRSHNDKESGLPRTTGTGSAPPARSRVPDETSSAVASTAGASLSDPGRGTESPNVIMAPVEEADDCDSKADARDDLNAGSSLRAPPTQFSIGPPGASDLMLKRLHHLFSTEVPNVVPVNSMDSNSDPGLNISPAFSEDECGFPTTLRALAEARSREFQAINPEQSHQRERSMTEVSDSSSTIYDGNRSQEGSHAVQRVNTGIVEDELKLNCFYTCLGKHLLQVLPPQRTCPW
jgi:hypothetical protein